MLACVSEGLSNRAVADRLGVSAKKANRDHMHRILYKLGVRSKIKTCCADGSRRGQHFDLANPVQLH